MAKVPSSFIKGLENSVAAKRTKLTKEGRSTRKDYRSGQMGNDVSVNISGTKPGSNARRQMLNKFGDIRSNDFTSKQKSRYLAGGRLPLSPEGKKIKSMYKSGGLSEDAVGAIGYGPKGKRPLSSNRARREMHRYGQLSKNW